MVNEGGNGRKKNRSRNKKKNNNKNQQGSPSTNQASSSNNNTPGATPDEQPTEFVPPPVAAAAVVVSAPEEKHRQRKKSAAEEEKCCGVGDDLAKHLIEDDDFVAKSYSLSSLQDAENSFYSSMEKGGKQEQQKKSDDELDLFASDDEVITEKPKMVKPAPKRKGGAKVNDGGKSCSSVKSSEMSPHEYSNPANGERSFIMLKPDAVQRNLIGEIVARFEAKGFKLIALKLMRAPPALLKEHYGDLSKKPFFPDLVSYMSSGPVVPMVWEGLNVVKSCRDLLGATNPADSAPGTIRGDYCIDIGRNIIHGSDSVESAKKEISLWFKPNELTLWRSCALSWLYEDEEDSGKVLQYDGY